MSNSISSCVLPHILLVTSKSDCHKCDEIIFPIKSFKRIAKNEFTDLKLFMNTIVNFSVEMKYKLYEVVYDIGTKYRSILCSLWLSIKYSLQCFQFLGDTMKHNKEVLYSFYQVKYKKWQFYFGALT